MIRWACCVAMVGGAMAAENPLEFFLPDEATSERLRPMLERLASESFAEREAASRELGALPALPPELRERVMTEADPEVRQRLRVLVGKFPVELECQRLNGALARIAEEGSKGWLASIVRVVARGVWQAEPERLHAAARATAVAGDLDWIREAVAGDQPEMRRIAVAALGGLPAADSTGLLEAALGDGDEGVVMLAAGVLAERGVRESLPALARLLDSADFHTRHRAHHWLLGLTGEDFSYDAAAEAEERRMAAGQWQAWAGSANAKITGALPEYAAIQLFNGLDLNGWELFANGRLGDPAEAWEVVHPDEANRILRCKPGTRGDLWTKARYANYVLSLEYKVDRENEDGGVGVLLTEELEQLNGVPGYLEVQILPGKAGDLYQIGEIEAEADQVPIRFLQPRMEAVVAPAGQWHRMVLTVRRGCVEVSINGKVVNRTSKGPAGPGRIVLRNEGAPVSYRNLQLEPLRADAGP